MKLAFTLTKFFSPHCEESRKSVFTLAEVFSPHYAGSRKSAFTLAEVLITLAIIGVVAAMTIPTLIQNHQKRSLEVATKKFYSMMSQAVKQYMADEGVDDLRNTALASDNYGEETSSPEAIESIRNFVTKYLKVAKECDHDANDCFATNYKAWNGGETTYGNFTETANWTSRRDYVLADGAVIRIGYSYSELPIDLYVDVNGKKGPNRVGYDLWNMDIFYDGVIDDSRIGPAIRSGNNYSSPHDIREVNFEFCKEGLYGQCFGHFLENNFKFDY